MNLFLQELKQNIKTLSYYLIGISILIGAGIGKGSGMLNDSADTIAIFASFPKSVLAVFGMNNFDISTIEGFYGVLFFYLLFVVLIYSAFLGADIFSKEELIHTSEFLYTKPISRKQIFIIKYLAVITLILIMVVFSATLTQVILLTALKINHMLTIIVNTSIALFLLSLLLASIGMCFSCLFKQNKKAGSVAGYIIIFSYIFSVFIDINGKIDYLSFLAITRYVDISYMVKNNGAFNSFYLVLNLVLLIIFSYLAYNRFNKRDINI